MAQKPQEPSLRVVPPGEAPPPRQEPMTLAEAIESGVYLEILRAQRRQMVTEVGQEKGPAKAAMHRQIALLSKEIAQLEAEKKVTEDEEAEGADSDADEAFDPTAL